jgi:hypothetical protein
MIKKLIIFLLMMFVLLLCHAAITFAQIAKEGSWTGMLFFYVTGKPLQLDKDQVHSTYEATGISKSEREGSILNNATIYCLGTLHAIKGDYEDSGYCVYTRLDGDKIFLTFKTAGKVGGMGKGTAKLIGGTGKCEGVEGNVEFTRYTLRSAVQGVTQTYNTTKGQWNLP